MTDRILHQLRHITYTLRELLNKKIKKERKKEADTISTTHITHKKPNQNRTSKHLIAACGIPNAFTGSHGM